MNRSFSFGCPLLVLLVLVPMTVQAGRINDYRVDFKHSRGVNGYFSTPHQIKGRNYWEDYKIIDGWDAATVSVKQQVEFAAGSGTADLYVPSRYSSRRAVGVYIHVNAGGSASLPSQFDSVLEANYCIGASPDNAGNSKPDPERMARVLDLVASLKEDYHVDPDRIYVGGYSGGALISVLCTMLYPDIFKGAIPTEHVMDDAFWQKAWSKADMREMATRGQRWAHILGSESYAFVPLQWWIAEWRPIFPQTCQYVVDGMGHSNAPAADFARCFKWVDGPVSHVHATTFADWQEYMFSPDAPPGALGPTDDYDADLVDNFTEYACGTNASVPDPDGASTPELSSIGSRILLRYRVRASDISPMIHTSTDLDQWDISGNGARILRTLPDGSSAFGALEIGPTDSGAPSMFFRAMLIHSTDS